MNNEVLERLKEEYGEDDDLIQLYEDWGILPIYMKYTVYWMNIHLIGCWNVNWVVGPVRIYSGYFAGA